MAKKPKGKTTAGNSVIVEPDGLVRKLHAEKALPPQEFDGGHHMKAGHGRINSRFKEGIDVSHYQFSIDWQALGRNENVSYVYIKATEGNNYVDEYYVQNLNNAKKAGISVGAYHFYRPNIDWKSQLEQMTSIVKAEEQDLVPMIDIEKFSGSESTFVANLKMFVEAVTKHYGKKPLLYTYQNFYNKHFLHQFRDYHWMIACYGGEPTLKDGRSFIMWQYSSSGRVSGIRGDVDRSRIMPGFELKQLQM